MQVNIPKLHVDYEECHIEALWLHFDYLALRVSLTHQYVFALSFSCATDIFIHSPPCIQKCVHGHKVRSFGRFRHLYHLSNSLFYQLKLCLRSILKSMERPCPPFSSRGHCHSVCDIFTLEYKGASGICHNFIGFFLLFILSPCLLHRIRFRRACHCLSIECNYHIHRNQR